MSFPDIQQAAALPMRPDPNGDAAGPSNDAADTVDLTDVEYHDYTDGAPAAAIELVLRERRDAEDSEIRGEGTTGWGEGEDESG
jgi:hypothetical protein